MLKSITFTLDITPPETNLPTLHPTPFTLQIRFEEKKIGNLVFYAQSIIMVIQEEEEQEEGGGGEGGEGEEG